MFEGFDQVAKKDGIKSREDRQKYLYGNNRRPAFDPNQIKMDEHTAIIRNVVYARDPKVFDSKTGHVNQRNAFSHENYLDIKMLI